jgi:methyl acetate hydrolase
MDAGGIDRLLKGAVAAAALPGVVAVAGDREGTLYEGASGRLSLDREETVRPDTIMRLGSMTKAITSVAALQLLERGVLELEQPVEDILPGFGELQVLEGFAGNAPLLRAPVRRATIRNLLTHTSGLGYWFVNADLHRYQQLTGVPNPIMGLRALLEMPLVADPGTRWEYGTSTDWLGLVIEAASGQDLANYCSEHIFVPLDMPDATFSPSDDQRARTMAVHARAPGGALRLAPNAWEDEPDFFSGGGGAFATGRDYLRFMRALLRGGELDGERVLRAETVELAFTDHLDGIPWPVAMNSQIPELSNSVPSTPVSQGFGLGFHLVLKGLPGMRSAGTGDGSGVFNCYYWIDRHAGVTGALLTQTLPFFDERIVELLVGFEIAVYAGIGTPAKP